MNYKQNFIIRFNDLSNEAQITIQDKMVDSILEDREILEHLFEIVDKDPEYFESPTTRVKEHIRGLVWRACERSWQELEIEVDF